MTYADGSRPDAPTALVEVQGYAYAALLGAADLGLEVPLELDPAELRRQAEHLKARFNDAFWDDRGWFALALDGQGRRVDSLTTNPGHALWSGIADVDLANRFIDRLAESRLRSGWGLRTLAEDMAAYDPLSYHNGSVWPHDTAICAAGAARYRRWDVVDLIVDGALDAATEVDGRPPELFAGVARDDVPVPVGYPASCSPQAWSSASILLLVRTMVGLSSNVDGLTIDRPELGPIGDLSIDGLRHHGRVMRLVVHDGTAVSWTEAALTKVTRRCHAWSAPGERQARTRGTVRAVLRLGGSDALRAPRAVAGPLPTSRPIRRLRARRFASSGHRPRDGRSPASRTAAGRRLFVVGGALVFLETDGVA